MAAQYDKCLNVLLLGETGAGKSTFVNSIINYVYYKGLDDAVRGKDVGPIPMKFAIYDSFGELHDVQSDVNDDNENLDTPGESATKHSKTYLLRSKCSQVRLIDTPGIGDTKGHLQDKQNLKDILEIISNFETIHGIVVILKSNETRLTTNFTYCLTQLMAELHRSAAKNIIFVLTHGRGSHYRPGGTVTVLKKLLDDIKQLPSKVEIPLGKSNMFVVDNEAIRYIHCQRKGIQLTQEEVKDYQKSWEKSSIQCKRLVEHLRGIEPHSIKNLVSVSEARNSIGLLQPPLLQILAAICDNETIFTNHKKAIEECDSDIEKLKSRMYVPEVRTVMTQLTVPQTVCKSDKCRKTYTVHGLEKVYFPQVCCKDCYVEYSLMGFNVFVSVVNFVTALIPTKKLPFLKFINLPTLSNDEDKTPMRLFCQSMTYSGACKVCQCNTSEHELEYYNCKLVEETREDPTVEADISQKVDVKQQTEKVLEEINSKIDEMSSEKDMVLDAVAHFAYFLEKNAIVPYSDVFEHVLDELNTNPDTGSTDEKMNSMLQSVLNDYRGKKEAVRNRYQDSKNPQAAVSPDDIKAWMGKLTHMKIHGHLVEQGTMMTENASRCQQKQRYHEIEFSVPDDSWFQ